MTYRRFSVDGMSFTWRQELLQTLATTLKFVLQRLPFLSHFSIVLLGIFGPVFLPRFTAFVCIFTHIVFACCQARTAYGVWTCWRGVRRHSLTDWTQVWEERAKVIRKTSAKHHLLHYEDVQHCVIVPAYKEDVETLKETLDVLASHPLASSNYHICLGMEEREAGASAKARSLVNVYRSKHAFKDIDFSLHPGNIVGEAAGKSSNVNWAARFLYNRLPERLHGAAILTVMDADTAFAADFFLAAAVHFATATPDMRARMMFVPPILFDRNCAEVPIFTRATDIFWSCAGIGGIYPSSQCKIPTSAYGVSLDLAEFVGWWDCGPEAIGEDLHFYCKALFETKGNLHPITIYSPASQCNVVGPPAKGPIASYLNDTKARWTQACRHLWGSLDFGYTWYRLLTFSLGRSNQNPAAYMKLHSNRFDGVNDGELELTPVASRPTSTLSPPAEHLERYTPSPSSSASTHYSTDDTLVSVDTVVHKMTQVGLQPEAPRPLHGKLGFEEDDEDDEGLEAELAAFNGKSSTPCDKAKPLRRAFRILVLVTRLYEAHLMVAHVFLIMFVLTIFPSAILRNGTVAVVTPYERSCSWTICKHALTITPFAATASLPQDLAPGLHPYWMMPDIVFCAMQAARTLGAFAISFTIFMCVINDFYHHEAAVLRWECSEDALLQWQLEGNGQRMSGRYLGIRAKQLAKRKWPAALFDYSAIPAGLLYGILPLLYAQIQHLVTNRMTYVVSAKGKNLVVPVTEETLRRSIDASRNSVSLGRDTRNSINIGRESRNSLNIGREDRRQQHQHASRDRRHGNDAEKNKSRRQEGADAAGGARGMPLSKSH